MRVMILTADYPPCAWSGIGISVQRQANALASLGIDVDLLIAQNNSYTQHPAAGESLKIHYLSGSVFPVNPQDFDIIHLHSLALSELALELKRRFNLPLIYTAHSLIYREISGSYQSEFWCAVQGRIFAFSDRVIFLSTAERSDVIGLLPEIASKSCVLPNGVPIPTTMTSSYSHKGPVVYAGRFAKSKGLDMLMQMIPIILSKYSIQFVLAGGHGDADCIRAIKHTAECFPDHCKVVGWLNPCQVEALFSSASLVLIPSIYEPFGLVALEAMSLGAPVLASSAGGLSEIVSDDSGGRQVHSRDPKIWAEEVLAIISDPETGKKLSIQGPKYVAARYNINTITERLIYEIYKPLSVQTFAHSNIG